MRTVKITLTTKEIKTLDLLLEHSLTEPFWGDSVLFTFEKILMKITRKLNNG